MLLLSMLSTITDGFYVLVSSSHRVRQSLSVFMLELTQPSEHRTFNCQLPHLLPFLAIIRQILQQHSTPKHVADDNWMSSVLKVVCRSDINTDGVFASTHYFGKLKFASSDEPDYSHTSVGGANRRTTNQVSPPNSALSIGGGN